MKSIFVINPISGRGHLDSYARLYCRALIELGYQVVLIAEADGDTADYLTRNIPLASSSFSFVSFDQAGSASFDQAGSVLYDEAASTVTSEPAPRAEEPAVFSERGQMNLLRRAHLVWREEGAVGVSIRCVRVPGRALAPFVPRLSIRRQVGRVKRALARRLLQTRLVRALNLPSNFDVGRIMFHTLLDYVDNTVSMHGQPSPDLVFFLYLDLMAEHTRNTAALDRAGARPWSGILFHPRLACSRSERVEGYFKTNNARGGVFLVPSAVPAYAKATPELRFALAPDVADLELPAEPASLASDMRARAGSRTIVLLIGSITAHKGIPTLLDVIAAADPSRFFFALVGDVHWETFGVHKSRIRSFYVQPPQNAYLSQGYIKSEREYNSIVAASDIVYAVYRNFSGSSNSLTKAAGFRRPILVSEDSLMGERVRRFNTGSVVPTADVRTILEKLEWLAEQPNDRFGFETYNKEHSLAALKFALADAIPTWLASSPRHVTPTRAE